MKTESRIVLTTALVAGLVSSCVNTSQNTPPEPVDAKEVSAEESAFRLFPTPESTRAAGRDEAHGSALRTSAADGPRASRPAHRTPRGRRPSLRTRLEQTTVPSFTMSDEESLSAVVGSLRDLTGLPLVVHPSAEDAALDAGIVFDFDLEHELGARRLLNLIASMTDDHVGWVIRHDAILFTDKADAREAVVIHAHDIRDIVYPRTDFSGPRIGQLHLLGDDDAESVFGGSEQVTRITEDELMTLVRENIEPLTWDQKGIGIEAENGQLIVVHSLEVQREVARFLRSMG